MKKLLFVLMALSLILSSCDEYSKTGEVVSVVDSYLDDADYKCFVLSDGNIVELHPEDNTVIFRDKTYCRIGKEYSGAKYLRWKVAEKGDVAHLYKDAYGKSLYEVQLPEDYVIKHKILRVTKYDGELNKVDGQINLKAHLLSGTSGDGDISSKGMKCPNMFINIYLEGRDPIKVNAASNQLWLDVEAGGIVIEKRLNGRLTFEPEF